MRNAGVTTQNKLCVDIKGLFFPKTYLFTAFESELRLQKQFRLVSTVNFKGECVNKRDFRVFVL